MRRDSWWRIRFNSSSWWWSTEAAATTTTESTGTVTGIEEGETQPWNAVECKSEERGGVCVERLLFFSEQRWKVLSKVLSKVEECIAQEWVTHHHAWQRKPRQFPCSFLLTKPRISHANACIVRLQQLTREGCFMAITRKVFFSLDWRWVTAVESVMSSFFRHSESSSSIFQDLNTRTRWRRRLRESMWLKKALRYFLSSYLRREENELWCVHFLIVVTTVQ